MQVLPNGSHLGVTVNQTTNTGPPVMPVGDVTLRIISFIKQEIVLRSNYACIKFTCILNVAWKCP